MITTVGFVMSGFLLTYKILGKGNYSWLKALAPGIIGIAIDLAIAFTGALALLSIFV